MNLAILSSVVRTALIGLAGVLFIFIHLVDEAFIILSQPSQTEQSTGHEAHSVIAEASQIKSRKAALKIQPSMLAWQSAPSLKFRFRSLTESRHSILPGQLVQQALASVIIRS
jgi:hypothetical protein